MKFNGARQAVNLSALDQLCLDYMHEEGLVEGGDEHIYAAKKTRRKDVLEIKEFLLGYKVQEALDAVNRLDTSILEDPRLLFKLQRQRFVEHLRCAGDGDETIMKAIGTHNRSFHVLNALPLGFAELARNDLAPRALDTYPEAYSEFQKTMLLLLSVGDDTEEGPNLLAEELASGAREELAATLVTALRQSKEAYDPELSLLLRYIPEIAVLPP
eukprot:1183411-Prorocentrum_minimum.AAC.4